VVSKEFGATLTEVRQNWSLLDVIEAHIILDSFHEAKLVEKRRRNRKAKNS